MNDDIKEDVSDLMKLLETTSKKEFYRLTIDHELVVRLYNYITNLQQEKEDYKSRCEKAVEYINGTVFFGLRAGKTFLSKYLNGLLNILNGRSDE